MASEINWPIEQRLLDLFGEHAPGAHFHEGCTLHPIAGRLDNLNLKLIPDQYIGNMMRLPKRKFGTS